MAPIANHTGRALLAAALLGAAAAALAHSETRDLPTFQAIVLKCSANLEIVQGSAHRVVIRGDEDAVERLETTVVDGRLIIDLDSGWFDWLDTDDLEIGVTLESLDALSILGSGSAQADRLAVEDLDIDIKGSGDVKIDELSSEKLVLNVSGSGNAAIREMNAADVVTVIRGSGDVALEGHTTTLEATLQGSGNLSADDLKAETVSIVISGSGDATLHALGTLDAVVRGSGDVRYEGNAEVTKKIMGSGSIREM
jgi:hypothetical protein